MFQNPMQLISLLTNSTNPIQMAQQMFGNNPIFSKAMEIGSGKSPEQLKQVIKNIAKEKGMSDEQLTQFINNFGLKF